MLPRVSRHPGHASTGSRSPWARAGRRRSLAGLAVVALVAVHPATGCIDATDVEFGNPNGLDRKNLPGDAAVVVEPTCGAGVPACPSFEADIYPNVRAGGKWRCADATCHGGFASPTLSCEDAVSCLASLGAISLLGKPYVVPDGGAGADPRAAQMLCSLQGACGSKMPKPPGLDPSNEDLCVVDAWLKCGAPLGR